MTARPWATVALVAIALVQPAAAQSWREVTSSRLLRGEEALDVRVTYGIGNFSLRPAPADVLYRTSVRYDEELFEPRTEFDGRALRIGVENVGRDFRIGRHGGGEMTVELTRSVPIQLGIEFGAGQAQIDLGGLELTDLDVRTGAAEATIDVSRPNPGTARRAVLHAGAADFTARRLGNLNARRIEVNAGVGDVTLDFTGDLRQDATVEIKVGLANLELRFPEGLGVKLERQTLLTSLDTQGLIKRDDAFYSLDWESAEHRLSVRVEAAFGNVDVRWVK